MVKECFTIMGPNNLTCGLHVNPELEIMYVKEGELVVDYGHISVTVKKGSVAIVFPYWLHAFKNTEKADARVIMFPYSISEDIYREAKGKSPTAYSYTLSAESVSYVEFLLMKNAPFNDFEIKSLYYTFITEFFRNNALKKDENDAHTGLLRKITDLVYRGNAEMLTVKIAATHCGVSEAYLREYIRKYTEMTFKDFVHNLQINRAISLMKEEDMSIAEIAYMSGFGSQRSFNRVFFSKIGEQPKEYRKKLND